MDFDIKRQEVERIQWYNFLSPRYSRLKVANHPPHHKGSLRDYNKFTLVLQELHSILGQLQTTMHHAQEELEEAGPVCTGDTPNPTCFEVVTSQIDTKKLLVAPKPQDWYGTNSASVIHVQYIKMYRDIRIHIYIYNTIYIYSLQLQCHHIP